MSMIKFALIGQSFNHQRISRAVGNIGFWWKPATCGSPPSLRPSLPSSLLDMSAVNLSECAAHRGSPYLSQGGDVILWCEAFSSTGVTWLQHASLFFFLMFFFSYPDVQSLIPDALSHLSLPLVRFFPLCLADCLSFTSLFFPFISLFFRCWKWSICALNRPLLPPLSLAPSHQHCCWASGVLEICQCGTRCRISLPACCDVPCPAIGSTDKE